MPAYLTRVMTWTLGVTLASTVVGANASAPWVARAADFSEHQARCAGKEGWSDPAPPIRIFGNIYDVGTCGITVLLIVGDKGAIIVDAATSEAVPSIVANIERLGLKPTAVKLLLSTHEHLDHAGGLNELKRSTGATMVATGYAKAALETGILAKKDPQRTDGKPKFRGVRVDRTVRDGEVVVLGSLHLTAHTTPGHSPGSTSWSWRSCEGGTCHRIVYADSVTAVASDHYRFSHHAAYVAEFRASLAKLARLPCDLIITPHPAASELFERLAGKVPLSAKTACASYAAAGQAKLDQRLSSESAGNSKLRPPTR